MKIHAEYCGALLWTGLLAGITGSSLAAVSQQIEPARIAVGDAARLTIAASGDATQPVSPPMVPGLEFMAVSQSQQVESVNGVTRSTSAVTYQVIPHEAGIFRIPGAAGAPPVVLTVTDASTAGGAAGTAGAPPPTASAASGTGSSTATPAPMAADGSAFVRLGLPKHALYVGETIPVDIEVGTHDGVVAAMNGPPVLNGDAFVLDKLSNEPQRSTEVIQGEPFTVFTWHSTLAAVKPGSLSLTMDTPLTVRVRSRAQRAQQFFDNPDDFFDQANLQSLFGGVTNKDVTVASQPVHFTVLALPADNRPADFSGAVGHFKVSSELTDDKAAVGDPLTLRLKIAGSGNFDRVDSTMLRDPGHWKTYAPTAKFIPDAGSDARGVKIFEQPMIATAAGEQTVPSLSFSWFDPNTRHYETAHTAPLTAAIAPATSDASVVRVPAAPATPGKETEPATPVHAANTPQDHLPADGLRPDHVDSGRSLNTLKPLYLEPAYVAAPSLLVLTLSGVLLWLRRRDRNVATEDAPLATEPLVKVMDEASAAGDAETFFKAARLALQRSFAPRWNLPPETIDVDEVDAHFASDSDVARVFRLADESAYAGDSLPTVDYQRWKRLVLRRINNEAL